MDYISKSHYELTFKVKYMELKGDAFQDFFADLMGKCHPGDYVAVRPAGRQGDLKCDGYLQASKTLFQVHAPDDWTSKRETVARAQTKMEVDFQGAVDHWKSNMAAWVFVHNAPVELYAPILQTLISLCKNGTVQTKHWGFEELRQQIFSLNGSDLTALLGPSPTQDAALNLSFDDIQQVVDAIAAHGSPALDETIRVVPPQKIEYNRLSVEARYQLEFGMKKSKLVEEYFAKHPDPNYGDRVAQAFKDEYVKHHRLMMEPDIILGKLEDFARGAGSSSPRRQAAILAVIAHLFESCDIFERPTAEVQSGSTYQTIDSGSGFAQSRSGDLISP